jgi:DNA invertase Pin-like site-specific DNA recombinase
MADSNLHPHIMGYCRVSTDGQSLDAQIEQLKRAGCTKIFSEKVSGAKSDRLQLQKALAALLPDDTLVVARVDRLARSTRDLLNVLHTISGKGAAFKSLSDSWCDTSCAHGRLMITFLAGIAEFERELIRARTGEGRARAKARGTKFGAPFKLSYHQRQEVLARLAAGETQADLGRSYGVDATTIGRLLRRSQEQEVHHLPVPVAAALLRTMGRR